MRVVSVLLLASAAFGLLIGPACAETPVPVAPVEQSPNTVPDPQKRPTEGTDTPAPGKEPEIPPLEQPTLAEEPIVRPAIVATNCALVGATHFIIRHKEAELLELSFKQCSLEIGDEGVVTARVSVQAKLNLDADVTQCAAFQIAMLFESRSTGEKIQWRGHRSLVRDLAVENIEGDKKNLNYFVLHDGSGTGPQKVASLLSPSADPGYPDIYWGEATIVQEDKTGPLAAEIRKHTPIVHRDRGVEGQAEIPDLRVSLSLEAYPPRAVCSYKDQTDGKTIATPLIAAAK